MWDAVFEIRGPLGASKFKDFVHPLVQEGLQEWDVAAGAFLASKVGARVELGTRANGRLVLAATPGVFAPLRTLIKS